MNKIFVHLLCFLSLTTAYSQIHEIGVFLGGSNYIGDVGSTTYIKPNELAFGLLYKWNRSPRHSYRFSYTQSQISGNDYDSDEAARQKRGYSFKNNIKELSALLEFNFFDFNLHDSKPKITPYLSSGISYILYDELTFGPTTFPLTTPPPSAASKDGLKSSVGIPLILGLKSNFSRDFVIGLEVGARYTFTDNLDGSNPHNEGDFRFGNLNNNDWYVFSGLTLTYTFGEKPCYCAE